MASSVLAIVLLATLAISLEVNCFPAEEQVQRIAPGIAPGIPKAVAPGPDGPLAQVVQSDLKTDSSYGYGYYYPYSYSSFYYPRTYYSYGYGYGYPYYSYHSPYYHYFR